jgi:hypothetical protein
VLDAVLVALDDHALRGRECLLEHLLGDVALEDDPEPGFEVADVAKRLQRWVFFVTPISQKNQVH